MGHNIDRHIIDVLVQDPRTSGNAKALPTDIPVSGPPPTSIVTPYAISAAPETEYQFEWPKLNLASCLVQVCDSPPCLESR